MLHISVDASQPFGALRNIAGMNNSPTIKNAGNTPREKELFDALHLGYVRHHDAALENPGFALIDVTRLFPLFSADASNPENYDFAATDDYLALIADSGCLIDFRFGESIEHSANKYRVRPPKDFEKWADICVHILMHYTQGWANGFRYTNIAYASVWEEANNERLFAGDYEDYLRLFVVTYRRLHAAFPGLKIGGPNLMECNIAVAERYLAVCKENGITPDFISQTVYANDPDAVLAVVHQLREACDRFGFAQTEVCITEFHLVPTAWNAAVHPEFFDTANAAYTASTFIRLMDAPVAAAYYYAWVGSWGIVSPDADGTIQPLPVYHGIRFFTETATADTRVKAECNGADVLAATSGDTLKVLVSCTEQVPCTLTLSVPGYRTATVRQISDSLGDCTEATLVANGDTFTYVAAPTGCTVALFTCCK